MTYRGYPLSATFGQSAPAAPSCNNRGVPALDTITPFTTNRAGKCASSHPFSVTDTAGDIIKKAVARAIEMLDNTITELVNARNGVCAGQPPAWPLLGDVTADWLVNRLGVCIDDIRAWTAGAFVNRSAAEVIRRLTRVRNLIASNGVTYVCNGPECRPDWWAYVKTYANCVGTPASIIRLCRNFWVVAPGVSAADHAEFQAQTIIHEASHLYHCTADARGSSIGVAECLAQFVAATNGSPIDPTFATSCAVTTRCAPATGASGTSGFGAAVPAGSRILSTVFRPQNAIRLKGRPAMRR
jgi:hypothetical protein